MMMGVVFARKMSLVFCFSRLFTRIQFAPFFSHAFLFENNIDKRVVFVDYASVFRSWSGSPAQLELSATHDV
jgi:hypothetical protein